MTASAKSSTSNGQRAGAVIVLLLGIGFGLLAILWATRNVPLMVNGVKTTATVIWVDTEGRSGRRYGIIEFRDQAGTTRRAPTTSPGHSVGDRVQIIYLPKRPAQTLEDSFLTTWGGFIVLVLLCAFLITGGTKIFRKETRRVRRRWR